MVHIKKNLKKKKKKRKFPILGKIHWDLRRNSR